MNTFDEHELRDDAHAQKLEARWSYTILALLLFALALGMLPGCASLGGPDIEQKLIAAASKCIADASSILAAQREADATEHAAVQLLALQREANDKKCAPQPDPAAAMPLQSRKP